MTTSLLSVVIPVKNVRAKEAAILDRLAARAPAVAVVAVGKISVSVSARSANLSLIDCDCSIYEAMNLGACMTPSRYLLFMGIDDSLIASNVGSVIAGLEAVDGAALVILPFRVGTRQVDQAPVDGRLRSFHHQGVLFRRESLLDLGGYGSKYRLHSDLDLMFRMQRAGPVRTLRVPLVVFAKGGMTTSGRHALQSIREFSAIYRDNRVSRLACGFAFSVALLLWYQVRFAVRSLLRSDG